MCSNAFDDFTDFEVSGFTKTQISKYLENEKLLFLQIQKFIHFMLRTDLAKKCLF